MVKLRIIYKKAEHCGSVRNVMSDIKFQEGYADFDTEDEHVHIPIESIVKIGNVDFSE